MLPLLLTTAGCGGVQNNVKAPLHSDAAAAASAAGVGQISSEPQSTSGAAADNTGRAGRDTLQVAQSTAGISMQAAVLQKAQGLFTDECCGWSNQVKPGQTKSNMVKPSQTWSTQVKQGQN
jgi:hypothetical protein